MAIRMSGIASGLDTDAIIKELMSAQKMKKTKLEQKKTKTEWKKEKWEELNKKLYSLYTKQASKMKLQGSYLSKKVTSSNESLVTATATSSAASGSHTIEVKELASAQYITGASIKDKGFKASAKLKEAGMTEGSTITVKVGEKETSLTIGGDTTIADFTKTLQEAGLNASFDEKQGRFFISSKESGAANAFTMTSSASGDLGKLGLTDITKGMATGSVDINGTLGVTSDDMSIVAASDARIILDGAELTDSSNDFNVAGIKLQLKDVTTGKVSLNVTNDADAVYKTFKEFIKEYNSILKELNDLYGAKSAKGYEPLTDEEKKAMSEDQVKLWEDKIKDSLLRRDGTVDSLTSAMRSAMQSSVTVDGKSYSLASFGIVTSRDYTEKGLLHINGDEEDGTYASETDKLKAALTENPTTVAQVLSKIVTKLSDTMMDKMKKTSLSSALTFYNDKEIKNQIDGYEDEIDRWEKRLQDMEDRYYKQFSAMETALSKLNSQSSYLSSLMGAGK